jgi:bifunctional NMN adenylyltransferase/nudix hydrolase
MRYKLAVLIGRFQPFHTGHEHALNEAAQLAEKVVVLVGSSHQPRTAKNPFTFDERETMIKLHMAGAISSDRLSILPIADYPYMEHEWIAGVQRAVDGFGIDDKDIVVVGHEKDESSYYLKVFPQWAQQDTGLGFDVDATKVREFIFNNQFQYARGVLRPSVAAFIDSWKNTPAGVAMTKEWKAIEAYKDSWSTAPFAPTFVTVDAVVVQSGHVLMIQRGKNPGQFLWALPGGFLDQKDRSLFDACVRELKEETRIKLQEDTIRRCYRTSAVFDAPGRDLRGRTITHAFLFKLNDASPLPQIRAADDAANARWVKLSDLIADDIYSDHLHIIESLLGKL